MPPEIEGHRFKNTAAKVTVPWRFRELQAAQEWGLTPSQFDRSEADDRGEMIAFGWVKNTIESYQYEMAEERAKSKDIGTRRNWGK
jgi:hypothetical protein